MAQDIITRLGLSIRLACEIVGISQTCYRYLAKLPDENAQINAELLGIVDTHTRWGFRLCFDHLRNVKGRTWNHKRVYRLYCELGLNLRIKPRKRIKRETPAELRVPNHPNDVWSMDFMSDTLSNGRTVRTFNVIDDFNREGWCLDIDFSLPSARVITVLRRIIDWRGKPRAIRCDNGPEYISQKLQQWAHTQQIEILYIEPGKPTPNAHIERFNRTVREELLGF